MPQGGGEGMGESVETTQTSSRSLPRSRRDKGKKNEPLGQSGSEDRPRHASQLRNEVWAERPGGKEKHGQGESLY